jgi:hypothetical protein
MGMARKLKVFRTAAGFNDAYVAAPSRKAALKAWGAGADLFARGAAEQVNDAALMAEPLKRPGEVILKSRGGLAEQLKALGPRKKAKAKAKAAAEEKPAPRKRDRPPSRAALDKAEAALETADKRHAVELGELEAERDAIERRIETLQARQANARATLERRERDAREAYREALARWSDD